MIIKTKRRLNGLYAINFMLFVLAALLGLTGCGQSVVIPTLDQSGDTKCQQTIHDIYNKIYCPDQEQVLENLFTEPFELNKPSWMATCENGPFTEVVEIEGPTQKTSGYYSYSVTVKFWYPEGKGSGAEPYTALVFVTTAIGDDGVCRISGASGGG